MRRISLVLLCLSAVELLGQPPCPDSQSVLMAGYGGSDVAAEGGTVSIPLRSIPPGPCVWAATAAADWIEILTPSGVLPDPVEVRLLPNSGAPRIGYVRIAGSTVTFSQSGSCCEYPDVIPQYVAKLGAGIHGLRASVWFRCAAGSECPWTAKATGNATLVSAASGRGSTEVVFSSGTNCTSGEVSGAIQVNGSSAGYFQSPVEWYAAPIVVNPALISFEAQVGESEPPPPQFVVAASASAICPALPVIAVDPAVSWLHVSASSGVTPLRISLQADGRGLAPGVYAAKVGFARAPQMTLYQMDVTLTVTPRAEPVRFTAVPNSVAFTLRTGDPAPPPQVLAISAPGVSTALTATVPSGGWIAAVVSGQTPTAALMVSALPQGRPPGTYSGLIVVKSAQIPSQALEIPVSLTIRPPSTEEEEQPEMMVSTEVITAEVESPSSAVIVRPIRVTSVRSPSVSAAVQPAGLPWLTVSPEQGSAPMEFLVSILPAGLAPGPREGMIVLTSTGASKVVRVRLNVIAPVRLLPGDTMLTLSPSTPTRTLYVTASGRAIAFSAESDSAWLTVTPATGATPANLQLHGDSGSLALGPHSAWLILRSAEAANSPVRIPVFLDIPLPAPAIEADGVMNSASKLPGPASPGSWIEIRGSNLAALPLTAPCSPLPLSLGGTEVLFDGAPISLHAVDRDRVLAQIPADAVEGVSNVTVRTAAGTAPARRLQIASASPGIFTSDGIHALTTSVAQAGLPLTIYAQGLGALSPSIPAGTAAPLTEVRSLCRATVRVTVGGVPAPILYAGAAPGQIGLYQVNLLLPSLPPGEQEVQLFAGETPSNLVTIRID